MISRTMKSMPPPRVPHRDSLDSVKQISERIAAPNARRVDQKSKFPGEAISALRKAGLLAAGIPREFGGPGYCAIEIALLCSSLAEGCSSTALIFGMHQVQLLSVSRHASDQSFFADFLTAAADQQLLVGSGTSEIGTAGNLRSSIAAIVRNGERFKLQKDCATLSYGEQAHALLVTARRDPGAAHGDQVLVLLQKTDYTVEQIGSWNAMGMRGTCSLPTRLSAEGEHTQIIAKAFRTIASETMVPLSHIVWSACWLGIARRATSTAQAHYKAKRRVDQNGSFGGELLSNAVAELRAFHSLVEVAAEEYDRLAADPTKSQILRSARYAVRMNGLKMTASRHVTNICLSCLEVCGMAGYLEDSQYSISRLLRDALSGLVMVNNQRLARTNAKLLEILEPNDWDYLD